MKHPKLFTGDIITIDEVAYVVVTGLRPLSKGMRLAPRLTYNVALRSVKYEPEKYPEYIYTKNTELPPFEIVK